MPSVAEDLRSARPILPTLERGGIVVLTPVRRSSPVLLVVAVAGVLLIRCRRCYRLCDHIPCYPHHPRIIFPPQFAWYSYIFPPEGEAQRETPRVCHLSSRRRCRRSAIAAHLSMVDVDHHVVVFVVVLVTIFLLPVSPPHLLFLRSPLCTPTSFHLRGRGRGRQRELCHLSSRRRCRSSTIL